MFNRIDKWKNREFRASIGEPWNFVSSKGDNVLMGKVIDVMEDNHKIFLLCDVNPFCFKSSFIKRVIVYNRYSNSQSFTIEKAAQDGGVIVHFLFNSSGKTISLCDLKNNVNLSDYSFLIGSFYLT